MLTIVLLIISLFQTTHTHISWSPIYLDGSSQVDLWTVESTGCACPFNISSSACACCIKDGGCPCGKISPNRCSQCGLEQYCNNACNMTINSALLKQRSNRSFGQIKSPSLAGPDLCWYNLIPDKNERVEIQIYRLIAVGKFNGSMCLGGHVSLTNKQIGESEICGTNERFTPPVVLFSDEGLATLNFEIQDSTIRSQFLAYFSFTPLNSTHPGVTYQPKGGKRVNNTGCDWIYHDFECLNDNSCILASPGYPGLYPAHAQCSYLITSSSQMYSVHIKFNSISFPVNHCGSDYITIHEGSSSTSPLLDTICSNEKRDFVYTSPKILILFRSGASITPYDYNGFTASLRFTPGISTVADGFSSTLKTPLISNKQKDSLKLISSAPLTPPSNLNSSFSSTQTSGCEITFYGNNSRSGHFDSRSFQWNMNCTIIFIGLETDIVHISLFNYVLKSPSCHTFIEFYENYKPIRKICSPSKKTVNDQMNTKISSIQQSLFISLHSTMKISLIRSVHLQKQNQDEEFIDGAYSFHDQRIFGTIQPDTLCNVNYFGITSGQTGTISNPGKHHLYWNLDNQLICSSRFIPTANQSVLLRITSLDKLSPESSCHTACGDTGCFCIITDGKDLNDLDHLKLINDDGETVSCLCGEFQQDWYPVSVRSWSPVSVIYSVAHYTYTNKGFTYDAVYEFVNDNLCGHHVLDQHSGLIQSSQTQRSTLYSDLNYYYNLKCTWLLNSKVKRSIYVELYSEQNKPCTSWNITINRYNPKSIDRCGEVLYNFCPRDKMKLYNALENHSNDNNANVVILKLTAHTRVLPQYSIKYYSKILTHDDVNMNSDVTDEPMTSDDILTSLSNIQNNHNNNNNHHILSSSVLESKNQSVVLNYNYFYYFIAIIVTMFIR